MVNEIDTPSYSYERVSTMHQTLKRHVWGRTNILHLKIYQQQCPTSKQNITQAKWWNTRTFNQKQQGTYLSKILPNSSSLKQLKRTNKNTKTKQNFWLNWQCDYVQQITILTSSTQPCILTCKSMWLIYPQCEWQTCYLHTVSLASVKMALWCSMRHRITSTEA